MSINNNSDNAEKHPGHLTVESDNLAMPEIHTHANKISENEKIYAEEEIIEENADDGIFFDNLAMPEIHLKKAGKKIEEEIEKEIKAQKPVNANATKNAKKLLDYLVNTAGKGIIAGQHTQTVSMDEIAYIKDVTGKEPKLRGFELLAYSPNINYDDSDAACLIEVYQNRNTMEEAYKWGKESKGIVTFSYHWFSPLGGKNKSFYAEHTDFDPEKVLIEGTEERIAFYHDMEEMAKLLKPFRKADIPVLWRPFHESDGTWFWWGRKGPKVASELYKLMFDYFVNVHHLDNLIWVWNCRLKEGYPGDEYVDVISVDIYLPEYAATDYAKEYEELIAGTSKNKVAALAEIGYLPDPELLSKSRIPFAYFMIWSREFCLGDKFNTRENLKKVYDHPYVIKL